MNRDDIIRMAHKSKLVPAVISGPTSSYFRYVEDFAAMVAAFVRHTPGVVKIATSALEQERARGYREGVVAEREACAQVCDSTYYQFIGPAFGEVRHGIATCADAIRARGKP